MQSQPIPLKAAFEQLTFFAGRTPEGSNEGLSDAFATVAPFRDGAIFIGHYAGSTQWERHPGGDEIVFVIEGETQLTLLNDDDEVTHTLSAGQLLIVPQNTWHRFDTKQEVKVLTATPLPEEHSLAKPKPGS